jgi:hypothetical protein
MKKGTMKKLKKIDLLAFAFSGHKYFASLLTKTKIRNLDNLLTNTRYETAVERPSLKATPYGKYGIQKRKAPKSVFCVFWVFSPYGKYEIQKISTFYFFMISLIYHQI